MSSLIYKRVYNSVTSCEYSCQVHKSIICDMYYKGVISGPASPAMA